MKKLRLLAVVLGAAVLLALVAPATSSLASSLGHSDYVSVLSRHATKPQHSAKSKKTSRKTSKNKKSTKKTAKKKAKPTPHIGQLAKDGDFAFKIQTVQCGVTTLGTGILAQHAPAGSQWCLVSMTVKDIKSEAQTYFASNQYAIDAHGATLSATSGGLIYLPNGAASLMSKVNPGVKISVVVPFQLAVSDTIKKFVLHDSAFSGGVTVFNVK